MMGSLLCELDVTDTFQLGDNLKGKTIRRADELKIYFKKLKKIMYTEISETFNSGMLYL